MNAGGGDGTNLLAENVVEVAVALGALQQRAAWAPKPLITHTLGQNALAFVVASVRAGVLPGNLKHPPETKHNFSCKQIA